MLGGNAGTGGFGIMAFGMALTLAAQAGVGVVEYETSQAYEFVLAVIGPDCCRPLVPTLSPEMS